MGCDSFAFMVTLVNEVENQAINRRTVDRLVEKVAGHPQDHLVGCQMDVWDCGRCFRRVPLMRSFGRFGRLAVTVLPEDLVL